MPWSLNFCCGEDRSACGREAGGNRRGGVGAREDTKRERTSEGGGEGERERERVRERVRARRRGKQEREQEGTQESVRAFVGSFAFEEHTAYVFVCETKHNSVENVHALKEYRDRVDRSLFSRLEVACHIQRLGRLALQQLLVLLVLILLQALGPRARRLDDVLLDIAHRCDWRVPAVSQEGACRCPSFATPGEETPSCPTRYSTTFNCLTRTPILHMNRVLFFFLCVADPRTKSW